MRIISYTQHFFNFFVQKIRSVNTDRILIQLSAYTADYRTGDECQKCAGAVDIFAQGVEPFADWLACAEVDAVKHRLFARYPEEASYLEDILTMASYIEKQYYPVNAKYALSRAGIMNTFSRAKDPDGMTETYRLEVDQLMELSTELGRRLTLLG